MTDSFFASQKVSRFPAAFDSECEHCFFEIYQGDEIGYINDEIACTDCCDDEDRENNA